MPLPSTAVPDLVALAYRKLKQDVYDEKSILFLRKRIAEFEAAEDFVNRLHAVQTVVDSPQGSQHPKFKEWIKSIGYRVLPKSIKEPADDHANGKFVTNVTTQPSYDVSKVNYFFDGPVELHIIAVLWIMVEGWALDKDLSRDCYGGRLHKSLSTKRDKSRQLFRNYPTLYAAWRDKAVKCAENLLSLERQSVCILSLDIQEFFYRVPLNFEKMGAFLDSRGKDARHTDHLARRQHAAKSLRTMVEAICRSYWDAVQPSLTTTHHPSPQKPGLPIGICFSTLIANWHLKEFDKAVKELVNPNYYGRYVDDILLVLPPHGLALSDPINSFLNAQFVERGILTPPDSAGDYHFKTIPELILQQRKCILHHFDSAHARAGLENFRRKLAESSSEFRMLPAYGLERPLNEVAWDLLYDGPSNRLRSFTGIAENRNELAKYLYKRTALELYTDVEPDPQVIADLCQFFKGRVALEFRDLWERVLTFLVVADAPKPLEQLVSRTEEAISSLSYAAPASAQTAADAATVTKRMRNDLRQHLLLSLEMALQLDPEFPPPSPAPPDLLLEKQFFREANLLRHHTVATPLLNYTDFEGSFVKDLSEPSSKFQPKQLHYSPRHVPFEQCMLFHLKSPDHPDPLDAFKAAQTTFLEINAYETKDIEIEEIEVPK